MTARRFVRWTAAAAMTVLVAALTSCADANSNKAGGVAQQEEPRVLRLASQSEPPLQLGAFAKQVAELSNGTLSIEFETEWRLGDADYEVGTLEDVREGKIDMAWVGARAFDTEGVSNFQALVAPLLIDSHELQTKVFEEGIPQEMLEGVEELDLVGIGVLPGPMRKMLGVEQPFVTADDYRGKVVGIQDSAVAEMTFETLGATPHAVPAEASLEGLDGYEQQLNSIAGNRYDFDAKHVTSNVNLWPRPLVIMMGEETFGSLSTEQQSVMREAASAAITGAIEASQSEEKEGMSILCQRGRVSFIEASDSELAALNDALGPVYTELESDPATKAHIERISSLKSQVAASPHAPQCTGTNSDEHRQAEETPIDGVYTASFTKSELEKSPDLMDAGEMNDENWGDFKLTLRGGRVEFEQSNDRASSSTSGSYTVDGNTLVMEFTAGGNVGETFAARWSLYRDTLTFERDEELGLLPTPFLIKPWSKVD